MTRIISVMAMVKVTVREGVEIDDDSIMLAADTAARRNEAHSDNMDAVTIWRERRVLGVAAAARYLGRTQQAVSQYIRGKTPAYALNGPLARQMREEYPELVPEGGKGKVKSESER